MLRNLLLFTLLFILLPACVPRSYYLHRLGVKTLTSRELALYRDSLEGIENKSLLVRRQLFATFKQYGNQSPEAKAAMQRMTQADAQMLRSFVSLERQYGWPLESVEGPEAITGAFMIVDHADLPTQRHYLPKLRIATNLKEMPYQNYVTFVDRVLVKSGKKQVLGTQSEEEHLPDGSSRRYLLPIRNRHKAEALRHRYGLDSLAPKLRNHILFIR
ncbi:MAG: hypothetical protein EOO61_08405 [Hymenobacter sp.]|nr:MAG: hypothetical protein EOO61_08405 [Hymenobacter sp.]